MIFFRLDECVAYKIALAAETIGIPQSVAFEAPQLLAQKGVEDVAWMEAFAKRGKATDLRVVFSSDGMMRHREPERMAAINAGLIVFYAPKAAFWRQLRKRGQAAYFLRWFDTMLALAAAGTPGDQYQLPPSFSANPALRPMPPMTNVVRKGRPPKAKKPSKIRLI
ncbi:MAG: hypothetical protein EOP83_34415 [Verrucomicrobiaceae bacterium]|nr:MAG: hypothetical protein EOP83_34415 [Verrucomicrobiaceae bacterium]